MVFRSFRYLIPGLVAIALMLSACTDSRAESEISDVALTPTAEPTTTATQTVRPTQTLSTIATPTTTSSPTPVPTSTSTVTATGTPAPTETPTPKLVTHSNLGWKGFDPAERPVFDDEEIVADDLLRFLRNKQEIQMDERLSPTREADVDIDDVRFAWLQQGDEVYWQPYIFDERGEQSIVTSRRMRPMKVERSMYCRTGLLDVPISIRLAPRGSSKEV